MSGAGAIEDGVAAGAGVAASGREDGSGGESKQRCSGEPQAASGGSGSGGRAQDPGSMVVALQHGGRPEGAVARVATGERVDAGAGLATGGEGEAHSALS